MSDRTDLKQPKTVTISESMLKALEEIPDVGDGNRKMFTDEENEILLKYWPVKVKKKLAAQVLHCSYDTAKAQYEKLTGGTA